MNNAFALLQRLRARQVEPVAGVLSSVASARDALTAMQDESRPRSVSEAQRILNLPEWNPDSPEYRSIDLTDTFRTLEGQQRLRPIQSLALHWIRTTGGLLAPLAVGAGKTLVSLLAGPALGAHRPVLLIPPRMQIPLRRHMEALQPHWKLPRNLHIIPYSQLSVASSTALLEQLQPDVIIADEAHNIARSESARTKRVIRYFRMYPLARFIALSGTMTRRSLKDFGHLAELSLREGSPVPIELADLLAWSSCIDADGVPQEKDWDLFARFFDCRAIEDLESRRAAARDRFRKRFVSTPGVVATSEQAVGCSLLLIERAIEVPSAVRGALQELRATWCRPDGEELVSALDVWRVAAEMSQGFWLRWVWPGGVVDWPWMRARAQWHRVVRSVLKRNTTGLDSPFLVYCAVVGGQLSDPEARAAWDGWNAVRGRPKPPTEIVWLSDFLVRDVVSWVETHPHGLVWYSDRAIEQALRRAGLTVYGAGETPPEDGNEGRGMTLSVRAHGTGLNLQRHSESLILSFPSSGKTAEQLIGRTHRPGQEADEVRVWFYAHTADGSEAVAKAKEDAAYIEQTTGSPQKLLFAAWTLDTVPEVL